MIAIASVVLIAMGVVGALALLVPAALAVFVCAVDAAESRPSGVVVLGSRAFYAELGRALYGRDVEESSALWDSCVDEPRSEVPANPVFVIEAGAFHPLVDLAPNLLGHAASVFVVGRDELGGADPIASPLSRVGCFGKRLLDLLVSSVALILLSPVFLLVAVLVRLDSKGPALFVQTRVGLDGRRFRFYKFRTMAVGNSDAEHQQLIEALINGEASKQGAMYKLVADPRVTRAGRRLRRTSLDELPQLWNVLWGDMSLVGPRPDMPRAAILYDARAWKRLRVKPGMTGLWQVSGRAELDFWQQVDLDLEYIGTWSLARDLKILIHTPVVVVSMRGAA